MSVLLLQDTAAPRRSAGGEALWSDIADEPMVFCVHGPFGANHRLLQKVDTTATTAILRVFTNFATTWRDRTASADWH